MVAPSADALENVLSECIATQWDISKVFPAFNAAVKAAGISLVPTQSGTGDISDGKQLVTVSSTDKLLLAMIFLFSTSTCWIDEMPAGAPTGVKTLASTLVQWGAQRFPTHYFRFTEV